MRWDWKAALGIAISVLLIWWVLRGVDLAEVWGEIRRADWLLLLAAVAVATSGFAVRAVRWKVFLHPMRPGTGFRARFAAVNIGFAANNLLPARVGEFARAWAISRMEPVSVSGAVGSLVVERFLDAVAIFALLLVALLHPSFPSEATVGGRPVVDVLLVVVGGITAVLLALIVLLAFPAVLLRISSWAARIMPGGVGGTLHGAVIGFLGGLRALQDPRLLVQGLAWSVGFWSWNAISFWLAFQAFGIEQGYATALFVQAIIALGVAVPSAPGFFGTFHAAAVIGLHEVYGVAEGATLAFAFGYHLGGFIPVTLLGLWYGGQLGLTLAEMGRAEEAVASEMSSDSQGSKEPQS